MVALSGSIAHFNLESGGDLDLFIVTGGRHVWSVAVAVLVLAKLLRRRQILCANFVVADTHLGFTEQDLFTANQVLHLKPVIGEEWLDAFLAANPFVTRLYPNALVHRRQRSPRDGRSRVLRGLKTLAELALWLPAHAIETVCRRLYAWHLRRRSASWRSPDQVDLQADYLKLHTQSHRRSVIDRFETAVEEAIQRTDLEETPLAAAGGRR